MFNLTSGSIPRPGTHQPVTLAHEEDMTIRKFVPQTQGGYIRAVKGFSAFLVASPDKASFEDLRRYQLHLVAGDGGAPTITLRPHCGFSSS